MSERANLLFELVGDQPVPRQHVQRADLASLIIRGDMNRTIKDATTRACHCPDLESLKAHVLAFVAANNFAKHLKALRWRTPFEAICQAWTTDPSPFKINPRYLIPGPNT